jgi:hypothetical protein
MDAGVIKQSLEGGGLGCTPQRYAVMAFLKEHNSHSTAAEIFEAVNRVDPRSSRATTYNNLRELVKAGLVREVVVEGRGARFGRKACGITTSSATAAAKLRTLSGTTCPGLPRAPSVSGLFANANSFSGDSARSAFRGTLPAKCRRRMNGAAGECSRRRVANGKARIGS